MLEFRNEELKKDEIMPAKRITAGAYVKDYLAAREAEKNRIITEFVELIVLCFTNNSYLVTNKRSVTGKSTEPACYIKFKEPNGKKTFEVLDLNFRKIELCSESAVAHKDIVDRLKEYDNILVEINKALGEEELALLKENDTYIVYPLCLEKEAKNFLEPKQENEQEQA